MLLKGCEIIDFPELKTENPSSSKDMDITLMYTIIRNVTNLAKPQNGWGNFPSVQDLGTAADIERFRKYRNDFAHKNDMDMETPDFNEKALDLIWVNTFLKIYLQFIFDPMHK